jgi:hypothetical protein
MVFFYLVWIDVRSYFLFANEPREGEGDEEGEFVDRWLLYLSPCPAAFGYAVASGSFVE